MDVPAGLGDRGVNIWEALKSGDVARDAIVLEAARTADRLVELDSIIQGKGVLNLMQFRLDDIDYDSQEMSVTVSFASPLSEARQQQSVFAALIEKIDKLALTARAPKGGIPENLPAGVTALDRIRERVKQETG